MTGLDPKESLKEKNPTLEACKKRGQDLNSLDQAAAQKDTEKIKRDIQKIKEKIQLMNQATEKQREAEQKKKVSANAEEKKEGKIKYNSLASLGHSFRLKIDRFCKEKEQKIE